MTKREIWHGQAEDTPPEIGLYATKADYGWEFLGWRDGKWWTDDFSKEWRYPMMPTEWIGPLPGTTLADKTVYVDYDL